MASPNVLAGRGCKEKRRERSNKCKYRMLLCVPRLMTPSRESRYSNVSPFITPALLLLILHNKDQSVLFSHYLRWKRRI